MTIDEVYDAIKEGDTDGLTTWLDALEVSPAILKILDSLCIYCVKYNQLDVLKLFVEYAANITVPWNSNYLLEYAVQLGRRDMIEYLKDRVPSIRNL